jgi:DNA-directed RNA polymerase subunit M/transcription elongation factor TFIIS
MNDQLSNDDKLEKYRKIYKYAIELPWSIFYKNNNYNNMRRLKLIAISSALRQYPEFKQLCEKEQLDIITHIENSCANETIRKSRDYNLRCTWDNEQFVNIYHTICCNIISVLDYESNTLLKKIMDKEIDLNSIAKLSNKELFPEKYDDITQKFNKRVQIEQTVKYTEMYFCKKCKHNKTTAERVQNRSNDEASSFHITCLFCSTQWFK